MNVLFFICFVSISVGIAAFLSIKSESGFIGYILGLVVGALAVLADFVQMGVVK